MKYYSYRESAEHRTGGLPAAFYQVDAHHPRYEMMHHWHREYELIYVRAGRLVLTLDTVSRVLEAGEFEVVNPGVIHSGHPEDCRYECVVFDADALGKGLLCLRSEGSGFLTQRAEILPLCGARADLVRPNVEGLFSAMRERQNGFELEAASQILGFFAAVLRHELFGETPRTAAGRQERLAPLENAVAYMEAHYQQPILLEELAAGAGFGRKYFSEYFKRMTGKSPVEYLNCYRIERACELLLQTERPITQIALDCGFNDLSYFIKTFRKQKSVTPGRYRRESHSDL